MEFISTREELRARYGEASSRARLKELQKLDGHCRGFLAKSPFVLIGSQDSSGRGDVTPKGDRPGFTIALDDHTLAIPDRPGNNRLDTWENLIENPSVGLLFLIPGMDETLRVEGIGRLTFDDSLRARCAAEGKLPTAVLVVEVRSAFMHCAKAFMRSELWKPETWPDRAKLPTLGQILKDQIGFEQSAAETDQQLVEIYRQSMW
ncbi:MAG TPA: pyridoxamine 5'-phosphate oxidase family protein [Mesorhizobium sp.]|nr:pyridoxamine 5'-phosphate oxidase family protein [Mesorhizobium sp.]